ncbi:hypothetical protein BJ944DRAFT_243245 [Cunninghamella echinulata]|nr:hypothetical protein BJ944DRAFT_243245 [Cunninghamella echinulata]
MTFNQKEPSEKDINNAPLSSSPPPSIIPNNKLKPSVSTLASSRHTQSIKPTSSSSPSVITQQQLNQPLPALPGNINDPWEIYFDPNYTFFGGTLLDSRKHKQQYEILQAMAIQDHHLHLHPPSITTLSPSSFNQQQQQQPSLPIDIMNSINNEMNQNNNKSKNKDKMKSVSDDNIIQQQQQQRQQQPMVNEKEHYARLQLLKAIRAETYHDLTFPSSTFNADHHPLVVLDQQQQPSTMLRNIKTHTISYQHRQRYRHLQQRATSFSHPFSSSLNQSLQHSKKHIKKLEKQDKDKNIMDCFYSLTSSLPSFQQHHQNESEDTIKNNQLFKLDDEKQVPLSHPPLPLHQHHLNTTLNHKKHSTTIKRSSPLPFFFFVFGFVCPPLWLVGAIYSRPEHHYHSPEDRNKDLRWKKYSKVAFGLFLFLLLILLVILLLVNPGMLGWRQSDHDLHTAEKFVPIQTSKST